MRPVLSILIAGLVTASPAAASSGPKNQGCGAGTRVLDVRYRVQNDVDTGVQSNNWAFDSYVRTVRVWRKAGSRYCAASTYAGTFVTIAGPSPGGTATIPAGIRGTVKGSSVTTFTARFAPAGRPTRGDLGTKDFACLSDDEKGNCSGTYDWLSAYFTSGDGFRSFKYTKYAFVYHATQGGQGTRVDTLSGGKTRSHGDIVPKKSKGKGK